MSMRVDVLTSQALYDFRRLCSTASCPQVLRTPRKKGNPDLSFVPLMGCLLYAPQLGIKLKTEVSWPGIEFTIFWYMEWCPNQLSHPARALQPFLWVRWYLAWPSGYLGSAIIPPITSSLCGPFCALRGSQGTRMDVVPSCSSLVSHILASS